MLTHLPKRLKNLLWIMLLVLSFTVRAQEQLTFVQLCDPQLGFGGYQHDSLCLVQAVEQINEIRPDLVVICGDLVHTPNDTSYSDFKSILSKLEVPYYAAPGNHDVENSPTPESLAYYRKVMGRDQYVLDTLGYVFVFVNSTLWTVPPEEEAEKQDDWLAEVMNDLGETGQPVFVISHHQLFMESPDEERENAPVSLEKRTELLALFSEAEVLGYLAGHTHTTLINKVGNMQLVGGETTSVNFDSRPMGFRLWTVSGVLASHAFVPLR